MALGDKVVLPANTAEHPPVFQLIRHTSTQQGPGEHGIDKACLPALQARLGPQLAHRALQIELGIGLLLPCNVCVWEEDGGSVVSIAQPTTMFKVVKSEALRPVADEADRRLQAALARIRENS